MPHTLDHLRYEASIIEELISPKSIPIGTINPGRVTYINFLFAEYARFTEDTIENDLAINHQQNGYQTLSWQNLLKETLNN